MALASTCLIVASMAEPGVTFAGWGFDVHDPGTAYGPRVLPDFDFIWIIDGEVEWECDGVSRQTPAGSLLLARPGMRDLLRWDRRVPSRNFFLHFSLTGNHRLGDERAWPMVRPLPEEDVARP